MMPFVQYSLNVDAEGVYVRYVDAPNQPFDKHLRKRIKSMDEFISFLQSRLNQFKLHPDQLIIMASSSMDFPQDYTKDPAVIALANEMRS